MFRKYLGLMPLAIEQFDLSGYDLVVSSSHAVAKGVLTGPGQLHVSYVHSPMRYAWDLQHQYLRQARHRARAEGGSTPAGCCTGCGSGTAARPPASMPSSPTSSYIAERIRKVWRRAAAVIYPPVDVEGFTPGRRTRRTTTSSPPAWCPTSGSSWWSRPSARMPRPPAGGRSATGPAPQVRDAAAGAPNIELRGRVPRPSWCALTRTARAFVFAAEEDFGIGMVEAQACGTPLIAFGRGGAARHRPDRRRDRPAVRRAEPPRRSSPRSSASRRCRPPSPPRPAGRMRCASRHAAFRDRDPRPCRGAARGARGGMKFSLIVATRGRDRELAALFDSLLAQGRSRYRGHRRRPERRRPAGPGHGRLCATGCRCAGNARRVAQCQPRPQPRPRAWRAAISSASRMTTASSRPACSTRVARRLRRRPGAGDADRPGRLAGRRPRLRPLARRGRPDHAGQCLDQRHRVQPLPPARGGAGPGRLRRTARPRHAARLGRGQRSGAARDRAPAMPRATIRRSGSSTRTSG